MCCVLLALKMNRTAHEALQYRIHRNLSSPAESITYRLHMQDQTKLLLGVVREDRSTCLGLGARSSSGCADIEFQSSPHWPTSRSSDNPPPVTTIIHVLADPYCNDIFSLLNALLTFFFLRAIRY